MSNDYFGLNLEFEDFDKLLNNDDLEFEPVPHDVFVTDKQYLGLKPLSDIQLEIMKYMTQILKPHTLVQLHGEKRGLELYEKYSVNEVIAQLGKGSGKDHTSRIAFSYIVYLLHALRDPLDYYGKSKNVYIDLMNLAVNAKQAQQVFFDPFKNLLLASPWFNEQGFEPRVQELFFFSRPIRCFSGHSESEGWEGFDVMIMVLDEISAFKTEAELQSSNQLRNKGSASEIYNMAKASVTSRFPAIGKVVLLSFPRYRGDFIQERYNQYVELQPPRTWGIKASTWEVNPTISREDLEAEFIRDPIEAASRFACEPPEMIDAYFRDAEAVRNAFIWGENPIDEVTGQWLPWFNGKDSHPRFIHVDLGLKHDAAALSMVHVSGMKEIATLAGMEKLPIIHVDLVKRWKALPGQEINFTEIRFLITELSRKFDVAKVTLDMWQSIDMIQSLRSSGISAEWHTVRKTDYDTMATAIYDGRLRGYWDEQLVENELLKLKILSNTKIDHPTKGSKDAADAVAGAIFQCITNMNINTEVDVEFWKDSLEMEEAEDFEELLLDTNNKSRDRESIQVVHEIPQDLEDWLMEII